LILENNKIKLNCGAICQNYINVFDDVKTVNADLECQSCNGR